MAPRRELNAWAAVRLLLAVLVLGGLALAFEAALLRPVIPVFGAWIDAIDTTFQTADLRLQDAAGELVIVRLVKPAAVQVLGGHVVTAQSGALLSTSASAGIVLQPLVLGLALLLAWPVCGARELALRLLLGVPLLALVLLLDVPMMLYGFIWNQEIMALEPDRFSLLVTWADFMNAGGRFALTVAVAAAAVALAQRRASGRDAAAALASERAGPQGVRR